VLAISHGLDLALRPRSVSTEKSQSFVYVLDFLMFDDPRRRLEYQILYTRALCNPMTSVLHCYFSFVAFTSPNRQVVLAHGRARALKPAPSARK